MLRGRDPRRVEQLGQEVTLTRTSFGGGTIQTMRLDRTAYRLEQEAGTVSQIAYRIGDQNANAFSRVFREV